MLVEVRPLEIKKWHGKTGQESFAQSISFEALYDAQHGVYATGLTAAERKVLEKSTGYDLSPEFDPEKPHPFWSTGTARVKLGNKTTVFDTTKNLDAIKVKMLKANKYIANSMQEYRQGLYPEAMFVIYYEAEEVSLKASKIQIRNKARKLASKMSMDERINIIQILKGKSMRKNSPDFLEVAIEDLVQEDTTEFVKWAEMDKTATYIRASVLEGIHRNILTKEGNAVYYMGDRIADTLDDACNYFLDPQNQQMKAMILEKLNS